MRQRKWWWAIFLWSIGVANTNAYVCYSILYDERVKNKLPTSHKKYSHCEFLEKLARELLWPEDPQDDHSLDPSFSTVKSVSVFDEVSAITRLTAIPEVFVTAEQRYVCRKRIYQGTMLDQVLNTRCTTITENNMDARFKNRLDGKFHPSIEARTRRPCQYCMYLERQRDETNGKVIPGAKRKRTSTNKLVRPIKRTIRNCNGVRRCMVCNVELCSECFNTFHGINYLDYVT